MGFNLTRVLPTVDFSNLILCQIFPLHSTLCYMTHTILVLLLCTHWGSYSLHCQTKLTCEALLLTVYVSAFLNLNILSTGHTDLVKSFYLLMCIWHSCITYGIHSVCIPVHQQDKGGQTHGVSVLHSWCLCLCSTLYKNNISLYKHCSKLMSVVIIRNTIVIWPAKDTTQKLS